MRDVLIGKCKPADCPLFAKKCNPDNAYGALMVSSEGACAAYCQYRRKKKTMTDFITMAHGNGGAMQELIRDYFVEAF